MTESEMNQCDVEDCDREGLWTVFKGSPQRLGQILIVCTKCRDELTTLWGWRLKL